MKRKKTANKKNENVTAKEPIQLTGLEQSLSLALKGVAAITLVNVAIMYWLPMQLPLSSFSAIRLMFLAYGNGQYHLIPVSVLICVLLFAGGMAVQKRRIWFPVLSVFYFLYELIELLLLSVSDYLAGNGYLRSDLASLLITTLIGGLLCIYCTIYWKNTLDLKKRAVVQVIFWFLVSCCLLIAVGQCIHLLQA